MVVIVAVVTIVFLQGCVVALFRENMRLHKALLSLEQPVAARAVTRVSTPEEPAAPRPQPIGR